MQALMQTLLLNFNVIFLDMPKDFDKVFYDGLILKLQSVWISNQFQISKQVSESYIEWSDI